MTVTLGAWSFPDNGTTVTYKNEGPAKAIILKGFDSQGRKKQLAMTALGGWDELLIRKSIGTNPDSKNSIIVYALSRKAKQYGGAEQMLLISQTLTRESHEDFTDEELFPLREVLASDPGGISAFGPTTLVMKDGTTRVVSFAGIEGRLTL